jgi:hypothetical protein
MFKGSTLMTAFARRSLVLLVCLATAGQAPAWSGGAAAIAPVSPLPEAGERVVSHRMAGIALNGFDPVAYFDRSRPVPGKPEHEVQHGGATWRFATQANRDAFLAAPDVYSPLFGGHDPLAIAAGRAVAGVPLHFVIQDGRLLVFASADTRARFVASDDMLDVAMALGRTSAGALNRRQDRRQ